MTEGHSQDDNFSYFQSTPTGRSTCREKCQSLDQDQKSLLAVYAVYALIQIRERKRFFAAKMQNKTVLPTHQAFARPSIMRSLSLHFLVHRTLSKGEIKCACDMLPRRVRSKVWLAGDDV